MRMSMNRAREKERDTRPMLAGGRPEPHRQGISPELATHSVVAAATRCWAR